MRVVVNGESRQLDDGITLKHLMGQLSLSPNRVATEVNRELVRRADYDHTVLRDGDQIEIVTLVGGG
jgi:sulfur carrier protein